MSQWRRWVRRSGQARRTASPRPALRLESLEGREVPSAVQYGATIVSASQSYNHPNAAGTALSGEVVPFYAMLFHISADDTYTLTNLSNTFTNADTFFALYQSSFNPSQPLNNLVQVSDNAPSLGNRPQITQALTASTSYILVSSGATAGATGDLINQFSAPGSGTVTFSTHALPAVDLPTVSSVTSSSAVLGGTVEGDGGAAVTERGVVYAVNSINSSPKIGMTGATKVTAGAGLGTFTASISGLAPGTVYAYRAYATNSVGTFYTSPVMYFTSGTAVPVGLGGIQVNDGSAQRSMLSSLTVTFSGPVSFAGGDANAASAFTLTRIGGGTVGLNSAVSTNGAGQTVVTLTFQAGALVQNDINMVPRSLVDGRYQLNIADGMITGTANGLAFDGDGNGTAGGAYQSPADTAGGGPGQLRLFRLFGDITGNGVVDLVDLQQLRASLNSGVGDPNFISAFDYDGNGVVDLVDVSAFRSRLNTVVF